MMERIVHVLGAMLSNIANQVGGTFLLPGSTFSLAALGLSLALFVVIVLTGKRSRPIRPAVLARAIFPRRMTRTASGRTDIWFFVLGIMFSGMTIGWAVFASTDIQAGVALLIGPTPPAILPGWASMAVTTALLFLAYEFAYWFDHFLKHYVPVLWHFHKVHHQAESLSLLTNARVHPVDTIIFYNIVALCTGTAAALTARVIGTGPGPMVIGGTNALIMLASVGITHLQHSHLWLRFGERGSLWLLGPAHHQIHHSVEPGHFNRNLGNTLTLFDRLFGTFHRPAGHRGEMRFGVEDGERNPHGLRAAIVTPFVAAARSLTLQSRPRFNDSITMFRDNVGHEASDPPRRVPAFGLSLRRRG